MPTVALRDERTYTGKPPSKMANEHTNDSGKDWGVRQKDWPQSVVPTVLPNGNGGFTACPELLTEEEAIRYLRLDGIHVEEPAGALRYYRRKGLLRATQVGKSIRYRRIELERLLDRLTECNPR